MLSFSSVRPIFVKTGLGSAALGLALTAQAQGIYTCVDAAGRKLSADRPIAECTDRVQRQLSGTGTVKREIGPTLTDKEAAVADEKARVARQTAEREAENKRRDRALVQRYPSAAVHDKERTAALAQIDEVIKASQKRSGELAEQRVTLNQEAEFYVRDLSKMPPSLKRRFDENDKSVAVQKRFVGEQENEKKRVNERFDEEKVRLKQLWVLRDAPAAPAAASPAATSRP
jgi:Domain of unknown function (DUF4124)